MWVYSEAILIEKHGHSWADIRHGYHRDTFVQRMEHLTCFVAGNLALGVANGAVDGAKAAQYLGVAKNLTRTCFEMYNKMPTGASAPGHYCWGCMLSARALPSCAGRYMGTCEARSLHWHTRLWQGTHVHGWGGAGLGPETVDFQLGALSKSVGWNILRPEAVESICMLHRITNDTLYQDWGWQIFQAFEKYSKVSTESSLYPGNCGHSSWHRDIAGDVEIWSLAHNALSTILLLSQALVLCWPQANSRSTP